jgi:hypothetical protein
MADILVCDGLYTIVNNNIQCSGSISAITLDEVRGSERLAIALEQFANFMTFDVDVAGYITGSVLMFWFSGYVVGNIISYLRRAR